MSIKKEASGRRSIAVEVEVPGTPEEVWKAIATGPGVSSWFVPTRSDEAAGGTIVSTFGPGMDSVAKVTAWDPPRRFAAESEGLGPNAPPMATEWTVEARSGGTCVVRVVHSLFAATDDWDDQLTGMESGWPAFFRILRLYLSRFRGQPCSIVQLAALSSGPVAERWDTLTSAMGVRGAAAGQPAAKNPDLPPLAGVVEGASHEAHPWELVLLEEPAPGAMVLNACPMGEQVYLSVSFYLYGERAAAAAERDREAWNAWLQWCFPPPAAAETGA